MNNPEVKVLIEYLKQKQYITGLEKDILDSWYELQKEPFDRQSLEKKIKENNAKYPEIFAEISTTPGIVTKPFVQVTDEEVRKNLLMQIELLCVREVKEVEVKKCNTNIL